MVINLKALLDLYDHKTKNNIGSVSAINAMIGEDLAVALFLDYGRRNEIKPSVVSEKVTQGSSKGVRLDRWISVQENNKVIYFQTEIKNWTAHSYRGKSSPDYSDFEGMKKYRKDRWEQRFDVSSHCLKDASANKVLVPMKLDASISSKATVRPLIIFWEPMHPNGLHQEYFTVFVKGGAFKKLWVFSMSNYVRNLIDKGETKIEVNMPAVDARIRWLNSIYK